MFVHCVLRTDRYHLRLILKMHSTTVYTNNLLPIHQTHLILCIQNIYIYIITGVSLKTTKFICKHELAAYFQNVLFVLVF